MAGGSLQALEEHQQSRGSQYFLIVIPSASEGSAGPVTNQGTADSSSLRFSECELTEKI
jgi:hypothetical protein